MPGSNTLYQPQATCMHAAQCSAKPTLKHPLLHVETAREPYLLAAAWLVVIVLVVLAKTPGHGKTLPGATATGFSADERVVLVSLCHTSTLCETRSPCCHSSNRVF